MTEAATATTGIRVGDSNLANALVITTKTLRHYKQAGLLPPPASLWRLKQARTLAGC